MLAALDRGEITDAKTVAALLLYARRRADAMIARRLVVRGRVQGVGYRDAMIEAATRAGRRRLGAQSPRRHGRGARAGRARGGRRAIVAWCRRGPPAARVDAMSLTSPAAADPALAEFAPRADRVSSSAPAYVRRRVARTPKMSFHAA